MNKLRWQILIVVLALVAIAILLLGQQPILRAFVAEPAVGGIYIEGLVGNLNRLNPLLDYANPADQDIDRLIFSGLVRFDDRGNPIPDLAQEWGVSIDGLSYNFTLRSDALWHDGEPVTSADFVFTTTLLRHADMPVPEDIRALWETVDVIAFDATHLQFNLPEPFAPFMDYLTFGVLPEHLLGERHPLELVNAPFNLAPVGTGPYRFEEVIAENEQITGVVLNAFEAYYNDRPFIDQIIFRFYQSSGEAYQAYLQGDVLGISQVSPELLPTVLEDRTLNLYSARLPKLSIILLNLNNTLVPFFGELEVRQALMHGINRQWLVDAYLDGQAIVADGPILPGTWAYNENMVSIPFDTDQAIRFLKDAGYTVPAEGGGVRSRDGISLSFELVHPDTEVHTLMAQSIQSDWAKLGISIRLLAVDYETLVADYLEPRNYQAVLVDLNLARSPDPDPYPFWHQAEASGGQNYSRWDDRRASEYLEQARVSISQSQRERLYRNFQTHFNREIPALPLFYPIYNYAVSAQVQGVQMAPLFQSSDRLASVTQWFLVARSNLEEAPAVISTAGSTP
ncbi:MAG: peptide ABC transporter substrate-binding protein [Chloroflexi bacterium]|nr:peptide ABC transporter substrate-binding protein [Chloroflexota bacterium]MQC26664.1 peptide ABC transporter substrate-binding protein [Chloroflexota bacterium]